MTIFFAFSDESGLYRQIKTEHFNSTYPFYLRASLIIEGNSWYELDYSLRDLKDDFQIPQNVELKYADIWTLREFQRNPSRRLDARLIPIDDYPIEHLEEFISRALGLLDNAPYVNIIISVSKNNSIGRISEFNLYKMHLQDLMQRVQMDLQTSRNPYENENFCLIFLDPISREINKLLTDAYNAIYLNGDCIEKYFVIKDCLHFEFSHHSSGIQFADYIAGSTLGYLQGRMFSSQVFNERIRQYIRQCPWGVTMGCGIIDVPSNSEVRQFLSDRFEVD
jgi:hypothetical protein